MKTQVYSSSPKRKQTFLISFLVMLFCALCSTNLYAQDQEAYVETDAPDYAPGSTVLIAGEYWTPGETVYLKVTHLSPLPVPDVTGVTPNPYDAWTVIADANGEVHATWYVNDFEAGAQLQLEAYTASGYDYRVFFTDGAGKTNYYPSSYINFSGENSYCKDATASPLSISWNNTACTYAPGNKDTYLPIIITWYKNTTNSTTDGTAVAIDNTKTASTTSATYTPPTNAVGTLYYYVTVSWSGGNSGNGCSALGAITSGIQTITINTTPSITTQPNSTTITYGANTSFTVAASGTTPLSYKWQVNTGSGFTDISNGGVYSGATSVTLTLTKPAVAMSGYQYRCVVSNICGSVTSNAAALTVNKAESTITATGPTSFTYSGSPQGPDGSSVTGSTGTVTFSYIGMSNGSVAYGPLAAKPTLAGTYSVLATVAADDNFNGKTSVAYNFTIGKAESTITATGTTSFTYSGSPQGPASADVTGSTGPVTYSYSGTGSTSYGLSATAPTNAGTYVVTATVVVDANYNGATSDGYAFTIGKAASVTTVTITGAPFTYSGSAITPASVTVTGAGGLSLTPTVDYANNINAGTATASYTYAGDANHEGSSDSKSFTIGKAASTTVVAITGAPFTYAGSAITPASVTVTGAGGLSLTPDPVYDNNINAGTATASYTYAGDANHTGSSDSKIFTIGQKSATVVADAKSKTYGDDNPALTAVASGAVPGGDAINYNLATTAVKLSSIGDYPITVTLGSNPNYNVTKTDNTLTVTKADLTVVNTDRSKVYGAVLTNADYAGSITGIQAGDDITITRASTGDAANATVAGSTYPIVGTLVDPDSRLANYTVTNPNGALTVTKADLTVVNTDRSKVYGVVLTNADYAGSITGIQAGDNITITRASTGDAANATVAGSTYPIVGTLVDPNGRLDNYNVTNPNGALTVTKADLTVVNTDRSKVYGAVLTNADYAGSITGIQAGDNITITRASTGDAANATVAGSTYPIVGTLVDPNGRLDNYNVTNPDGALTVTAKAASVVVDAKSKTYGEDNPTLTAVVSGTVNGDNLNYTLGTIAEKFSNVGAYPISITLGSNPNYIVTPTDALLIIGQKAISVTANDGQTKLYGNNDPVLTYQITSGSLVNGDALNGQLGRDGGENVGSYPINQGTLANSNYNITFTNANFTITPRSVVVTPNSGQGKKYGSSDPALLYGTNPALLPNGSTVNLNGSLMRSPGENVGNYSILQNNIVTANNPNYTITFTDGIMFAITPSSVTATVTMNKDSVQYSDVAIFTATIAGGAPLLSGGPQAATSATFYVGTQPMGPANLTVNGKDLVATLSATLLETIADQMMPGSKTLRVNFNGINSNYDVPASVTSNVMLARENAIVNYSGVQFASTSGISSSTAIVTLAATIQDITAIIDNPKYDAYPGDIRKAKVRFMNMDSNTPITDWLPVALINSTDLKTGTVMFDWTTNIGSNDALQFTLGVQVDGYYVGTSDNTIVTVAKPLDNFVTGGGNLLLTNAVSGTKDGDIGSKLNFGFNVKYDASKNELKGHFNAIIFRTEDQWGHKCMPNHGMLHQFKIDGDDMISLAVVPATATSPAMATFTGKLDIRDNQHSNILFANGATVMVTMTDYGQPGKNDRLGITVWNPDGSLLFSSNWGLIRTAEQKLNDGNLEIHSKVVFKTGSIQPTVTLVATPTSGVKGTPITFNVTVKGSKNMPTGSVTFKDNETGTVLTTVLLSNGTATFTTSSLGVGPHNVDAYYGGNNTYSSADDDAMIEITMPLNSSAFNSEHPDPIELNVYPNPFGSHLFFKLQTPEDAHALLEIFDISGRKIAVAFDQVVSGNQLYAIDYAPAGNVATGMLIYRLTVGQKVYMGKVIYQPR